MSDSKETKEEEEEEDIISKIDEALAKYYRDNAVPTYKNENKIGKFKFFCDENGFEPSDITEELQAGADECMLVDFDSNFPLYEQLNKNEKKRNKEIFRVIQHCANHGEPPEPRTPFNFDVKPQILRKLEEEYKSQLPVLAKIGEKEPDLWYFLALGKSNNVSFLTNMVDLYTKDKTYLFSSPKNKQNRLTVEDWCTNYNNFMMELKRINTTRAEKLKTAMISYSNRIMCRLQFTPTYKIMDDIEEISQYIISVPLFIDKLINQESISSAVPFHVDLLIAVRDVKECTDVLGDDHVKDEKQEEYDDDDDDDDEYEDEDDDDDDDNDYPNHQNIKPKSIDPKEDKIGSVKEIKERLIGAKCKYFGPEIIDQDKYDKLDTDTRVLLRSYQEYRTVLRKSKKDEIGKNKDDKNKKDKNENKRHKHLNKRGSKKYAENEHLPFNDKSYPQRKRFEIFIDRRTDRDNNENKKDDVINDQMIFFQPPSNCDSLPSNHCAEWFFEAVRTCLIPSKDYENEKYQEYGPKKTITAKDNLCGQLLTFSFHVNSKEEIKCYIIWNGQTMRFHGDYITKVLPSLFDENIGNNKIFINGDRVKIIQQQFDKLMPDKKFQTFCSQYN